MHPVSDGVVTLLFSDVEGSTRLAQTLGPTAWADCLETHQALLRQAFDANHGREVDTEGDAFFVVFQRASDAVAAAIAAQQRLEANAWPQGTSLRVRIGLHSGEVLVRGNRYVGTEVHRASRICEVGHGGQIVVSSATAELVRAGLPDGVVLTDLGDHRLKDFDLPQRLFQLTAAGLDGMFPQLRSLAAPHNLPSQQSTFVGRDDEIAGIVRWLEHRRLVTLTGVGGSGKTRLALQVCAQVTASFPDGVFFVDLAPIGDADLVAAAAAAACGALVGNSLAGSHSLVENLLAKALARRHCLLLLDNCEHLLDAVAVMAERLLAACPDVVLLATSREPLGLEGEQVVPVHPLSVDTLPSPEQNDAVRLFIERARSVNPTFECSGPAVAAVVELCRRLDGIPLAIEFAAARVAHLSVQQIAERLADRFRLLTGGRRRIQRQQTLGAALDWSYDLLTMEERVLFRRLAVFAGSFSLKAVEGVCAERVDSRPVIDILGSLVAKSLVTVVEDDSGRMRYRLLETVRLYASDKLGLAGEAEQARAAHRDWFVGWLENTPLERLVFSERVLAEVSVDIDNLRACADWCEATGRPDLSAALACRLYGFWWFSGHSQEGRRRLLGVLGAYPALDAEHRAACHAVLAGISTLGDGPAWVIEHATRAIELGSGSSSAFTVFALSTRGLARSLLMALFNAGPEEAIAARRDAGLGIAAAGHGLPVQWRAFAHGFGAYAELALGDIAASAREWSAVVAMLENDAEPGWMFPMALSALSNTQLMLGNVKGALETATRCRALLDSRTHSLTWWHTSLIELAPVFAAGGQEAIACRIVCAAAGDARRLAIPLMQNHLLCIAGVVEHLRGHPQRAGRLLAASRFAGEVDERIPFRTPTHGALYGHYLPLARAALGSDESHRARDEGRRLTLDQALAYAMEDMA